MKFLNKTNLQTFPSTENVSPKNDNQIIYLPITGFVRLPQILHHIPISKSGWWLGVKQGKYPQPVKIGPNTTAWRAEDIHELIKKLGGK
jgi:prophage regulatory protein